MSRRMPFQEAATLVKQNLDVIDVIGRYVSLKKRGRNHMGLCPFHSEKTPSFNVNPDRQMFKCFGCGEGGDTLAFLMKQENKTYGEIISELAEEQGIEIIYEGRSEEQVTKSDQELIFQLYTIAGTYYREQLQNAESVKGYLSKRQIPVTWQTYFGLGFAPPGWENLVRYIKSRVEMIRKEPMLLEKAGLANIRSDGESLYDRFRNRLMIPIHDDRGRLVAFGARSLDPEDNPKYLNSPETAIYTKNRLLYGLSYGKEAIRASRHAILMEGYFDVISAHMAGLPQAVGVCGTALTENHLKLLQRSGAETFYLCFDSDEAGQAASLRAIELVENQLLEKGISLKIVVLPGEKDPDDFLKMHGKERFQECLNNARDFLDFKFSKALSTVKNPHSSEGHIEAVQILTPMLLKIQQPIIRQEHIRKLAEQLKISEETLLLEVKRLENRNVTYQNKKSQEIQAISEIPQRYIERKGWNRSRTQRKAEDIMVFRRSLDEKLPIEEKEHLLMSYLFLNDKGYKSVMEFLPQLDIQSPLASALLRVIHDLEGKWATINELIDKLNSHIHNCNDSELLKFLAERVVTAADIQELYEDSSSKGSKSTGSLDKLSSDIADIADVIRFHKRRTALNRLAQSGKELEQQSDDSSALEMQIQLREAHKLRSPLTPALSPSGGEETTIVLEE